LNLQPNLDLEGITPQALVQKRNNVPSGAVLSGGVCMTKKIFALVMVVSVLGAFLAGCKKDEDTTGGTAPASTAPAADTKS
jgi:hypothetical protein